MATVLQAVNNATRDVRVRAAMLLGALLESGTLGAGPFGVGDSGTSYGPFQMHVGGALTSSGLTPRQAEDPELAVLAMKPIYEAAVNQVPGSLWRSDPSAAAALAVWKAERPKGYPYGSPAGSYGQAKINASWAQVQKVLKGGVAAEISSAASTAKDAAGAAATAVTEPVVQAVEAARKDVGKFVTTAGFVAVGLGLVTLGAWRMFQPTIRRAQDRAAQLGGQVVKGAVA